MADDEEVTPFVETFTTNYGWTKPEVGASIDAWGAYLNADLDGIDTTVKSVSNAIPAASSTTPVMSGAGAVGAGTTWARADHVHPLASQAMGDNRLINGDMRIDQRNNGASGTANAYTVDRWQYQAAQASKITWGRAAGGAPGFPFYLGFTSSSAYASLAGDYFFIQQALEGDAISDFQWGSSSAQPVTLSFWAYSTLAGTFSGCVKNYAATRSYPFTYSIPVANTWTRIVVTILGDTGGTWVMSTNAGALYLVFDLGSGSTYRGSAGAWASANYQGATGSVSTVGTNGAVLILTGVKLEIGSVATPYNRQSLAKSQADCERYCRWQSINISSVATAASQTLGQTVSWLAMRAAPTAGGVGADPNNSQANVNTGANGVATLTPYGAMVFANSAAAGVVTLQGFRTLLTAEL